MTNEQTELHSELDQDIVTSEEASAPAHDTSTRQTDAEPPTADDPDESDTLPPPFVAAVMGELVTLKREVALVNYHKDVMAQTIPSLALACQDRLLSDDPEERQKAITDVVGVSFALGEAATQQVREMTAGLAKRVDAMTEAAHQRAYYGADE